MPLTDTTIRNAKPGAKSIKLFDERGLYLEITPPGGKLWRLKYTFGGKEKRLSFGAYPDVSLKAARAKRDDAQRMPADGIDPSEARKAAEARALQMEEDSFEAIATEWAKRHLAARSESHRTRVIRRMEREVFPSWARSRLHLSPRPTSWPCCARSKHAACSTLPTVPSRPSAP